jgi:hypothetical protein
MVLQVRAHSRLVQHHGKAKAGQMIGRPDPRELQQPGRADGAGDRITSRPGAQDAAGRLHPDGAAFSTTIRGPARRSCTVRFARPRPGADRLSPVEDRRTCFWVSW